MDEKTVNFLLELANKPEVKNGHLGIVFNGVLRGLARTYNARAWEYLRHAIVYGTVPEVSRPTAILAFADIVRRNSFIGSFSIHIILEVRCQKQKFSRACIKFRSVVDRPKWIKETNSGQFPNSRNFSLKKTFVSRKQQFKVHFLSEIIHLLFDLSENFTQTVVFVVKDLFACSQKVP
jgi:hypothetical protein